MTVRLPKPLAAAIKTKALIEKTDTSTIIRRLIAVGADEVGLKNLY